MGQTQTLTLDEALAVSHLRRWGQDKARSRSCRTTSYKREGWTEQNNRQSDAAHVRVIDFERALGTLEPRDQVMLVLIHRDGHSPTSAAAALGCDRGTIRYRAPIARRALADALDRRGLL